MMTCVLLAALSLVPKRHHPRHGQNLGEQEPNPEDSEGSQDSDCVDLEQEINASSGPKPGFTFQALLDKWLLTEDKRIAAHSKPRPWTKMSSLGRLL